MSGDGVLQQMAASLAAMAAEMSQLRAENAALRLELREALSKPVQPQEQERPRYQIQELCREYCDEAVPVLAASKELSPSRVALTKIVMPVLLKTLVNMPDGRKQVEFGTVYYDELSKYVGKALRDALMMRPTNRGGTMRANSADTYISVIQSCLTWHSEHGRRLGTNPLHGTPRSDPRKHRRK